MNNQTAINIDLFSRRDQYIEDASDWLDSQWRRDEYSDPQYDDLELMFEYDRYDLIASYLYDAGAIEEDSIEYWAPDKRAAAAIVKGLRMLCQRAGLSAHVEFLKEINAYYRVCRDCNSHIWLDDRDELNAVESCPCCLKDDLDEAVAFNPANR